MANTWSQRFVELKARRIDSKSSFKAGETFVFSINSSRDGSATGFLTTLIFRVVDCFGCGSVVHRAGHCHKVDGRVVADLTVTEALASPYLVFPPRRS
jgi:hypothetical protein